MPFKQWHSQGAFLIVIALHLNIGNDIRQKMRSFRQRAMVDGGGSEMNVQVVVRRVVVEKDAEFLC